MAGGSGGASPEEATIHRNFLPEREIRYSIAAITFSFALAGGVAALSNETSMAGWRGIVVAVALLSTVPAAVIVVRVLRNTPWWRPRGQGTALLSTVFIVYADVGVAAVLLTYYDAEGMMYGTGLFGAVGVYVAFFARRRLVICHVVFTATVILVFMVMALRQGVHDAGALGSRAITSLILADGTVLLINRAATQVRTSLMQQYHRATRDPLTGLRNRRGFSQWVEEQLSCRRGSVGFALVDIDHFKQVNDTYGHDVGDQVLATVAGRLREAASGWGIVARTGGEEFAVVAVATPEALFELVEAMRRAAHDPEDTYPVTVSIGLAVTSLDHIAADGGLGLAELVSHSLTAADAALYKAKTSGRNRVMETAVQAASLRTLAGFGSR